MPGRQSTGTGTSWRATAADDGPKQGEQAGCHEEVDDDVHWCLRWPFQNNRQNAIALAVSQAAMTVTEMMVAIFIATSRSEAAGNVAMLVRKRYLSVAPAAAPAAGISDYEDDPLRARKRMTRTHD